jgi:hypothetical protein
MHPRRVQNIYQQRVNLVAGHIWHTTDGVDFSGVSRTRHWYHASVASASAGHSMPNTGGVPPASITGGIDYH